MLELAVDEAFFYCQFALVADDFDRDLKTLDCPSCISLLIEISGHSWISGLAKASMIRDLFQSLTKLIHHRYMLALYECCKLEISLVFSLVLICVRLWAYAHV